MGAQVLINGTWYYLFEGSLEAECRHNEAATKIEALSQGIPKTCIQDELLAARGFRFGRHGVEQGNEQTPRAFLSMLAIINAFIWT